MGKSKNVETEPATFDELKALPLMEGLPDLVRPQDMTVSQSLTFEVVRASAGEAVRKAQDSQGDTVEATIGLAGMVSGINDMFRELSVSGDVWDEWVKGRDFANLFETLTTLVRFYADQLGKSSESRTRSVTVE